MSQLAAIRRLLDVTRKSLALVYKETGILLFLNGILLALRSVFSFLGPAVFALVINHLASSRGFTKDFYLLLFAFALTEILPSLLSNIRRFVDRRLYLKFEEITEIEFLRLNSSLDVAQHEDPKIQDQINKVTGEGQWRIRNFIDRIAYIFEEIITLLIASAILFKASWWTLPLLFIASLPEFIISNKYGHNVWSITSVHSEARRKFWNLRSHFTHFPYLLELKLFQNVDSFRSRVVKLFKTFLNAQFENEKRRTLELLAAQTLSQTAQIIIIIFFISQVVNGNILIGTLTFLITTINRYRGFLTSFFESLSNQYQDSLFIADFFDLKALKPVVNKPAHPIYIAKNVAPTLEFKNVSFKYPDSKRFVLKKISFTLNPGEKLALVGVNGAGKTTLVKLLCRFYDPTSGEILVNGHDLKAIDLDSWYYHLGILFQQYAHYDLKANEAISIGRTLEPQNIDLVKAASKHAGTHDFIIKWPKRYRQQLGKEFTDGIEPSVGQWQKLALARVFYRNANLLILDEPTASLDAEAEAKIFKHLDTHEKNKSAIFISHRFSTVRNADKIIVIKNGLIAESGSHHELMKKNKIYARLFNLQAKSYR